MRQIPYSCWFHSGRMPYKILALHEQYGKVEFQIFTQTKA